MDALADSAPEDRGPSGHHRSSRPKTDFLEILRVLLAREVDCIVVGGVSGVLHGAPIATFDLDIVHSRAPENVDRLLEALVELEAFARAQGQRGLRPDRTHLVSAGDHLLMTKHGPLDLLGAVGAGRGYEDLIAHSPGSRSLILLQADHRFRGKPIADSPMAIGDSPEADHLFS